MSFESAIKVEGVGKCFQVYRKPIDRLKQFALPKFYNFIGLKKQKYFKEFWALKNIFLEIKKGEVVGIIGRNGSGKSTLLQMICGTLNSSTGHIQTKGRIAALLELGSGFNPDFSGRENLYMNGAVLGLSRADIDKRFESIVTFADIGDFLDLPVKTYSSGMLVRLAFSLAINIDPDILIVDEALSVGDELFQRKCFARIESIRAKGATIIFVSHSGAQIIELCDRAVLLDDGEMILTGSPKEIVNQYHRLLYSSGEKKNDIRESIINSTAFANNNLKDEQINNSTIENNNNNLIEETLDCNLISSTTIEFESHGPRIELPEIFTLDGIKVNGLVRGRYYRYCYKVVFHADAECVRFGMSIKTTSGLPLAGAHSSDSMSAIDHIESGAILEVEFIFCCNFNPGIYFMNAGVFGLKDNEEHVLHRLVDVVVFRVLPIKNNIETEVVSLGIKASTKEVKSHV